MEKQPSSRLAQALEELQSGMFRTRKAAAKELGNIKLTATEYPDIQTASLADFQRAVKQAALAATDAALFKKDLNRSIAPGLAGIVVCILGQYVLQIRLGHLIWGLIWGAATVWMGFCYFRGVARGVRAQTDPARRVVALGKEIGILKK